MDGDPVRHVTKYGMKELQNAAEQGIVVRGCKAWITLLAMSCLVFAGLVQVADASEGRRLALLIGNADYTFAPLKNPLNDANDLGDRLSSLGFETKVIANPGYGRFRSEIRSFYQEVSKDPENISVFYYAGHAVQMNNVNFLIAVDSRISDQQSLIDGSISINDLLRDMALTSNLQNLVILDACRDNPFKTISTADQSRGLEMPDDAIRDLQQGLAPVEAPAGTIIAYATAPGGVAKDGKGRNGTYTRYLLEHLDEQRPVEEVFKRVRKDVVKASGGKQIPWEHSSLYKTVYFYPPRNEEIPEIGGF